MKLKGFVALITGASSGMGYEMAKALLSQDATVIIGARKGPKLNKAYEQLSSAGYDVHAVPLDIRDETSVMDAVAWFEAHFDHLDMLVNNAGIGDNAPGMEKLSPDHRFYDIPAATVRAVVETNMLGHFLVANRFCSPDGRAETGQSRLCLDKYQHHDAEGAIPIRSLQSRCRGNDGHHGRGTPRRRHCRQHHLSRWIYRYGHGWRGCKSLFPTA